MKVSLIITRESDQQRNPKSWDISETAARRWVSHVGEPGSGVYKNVAPRRVLSC